MTISPIVAAVVSILWALGSYFICRQADHYEISELVQNISDVSVKHNHLKNVRMPIWVLGIIAGCAAIEAIYLPSPFNASVSILTAGLGIAAWSDWLFHYLYDDVIITTGLLAAGTMYLNGHGVASIEGGVFCGISVALFYFATLKIQALGFGDVKVAMIIGFGLGAGIGFTALFFSIAIFSLWNLAQILIKQTTYDELRTRRVPMGPSLAVGIIIASHTGAIISFGFPFAV